MMETIMLSDLQIIEKLQQYLEKLVNADLFSGAVLLAKNGEAIYKNAYGLANQAHSIPNKINTKFNLGSMNKMFTGISAMQLVQAGKISLQNTIKDLVPDYPNREIAQKVTVHQLLTHTSGMGSFFNKKFMDTSREILRSVEDFLPLIMDEPLLFEPGTSWSYSNSGFLVMGYIIEKISGMAYEDYVQAHIFQPAGMKDTAAYDLDYDWPNLATGYTEMGAEPGRKKNNIFSHVIKGGPAGGGFSTVEDLLRFDIALRSNKLLNPEYTQILTTPKAKILRDDFQYGYGFETIIANGQRIVGHGGGAPGINSHLQMYLDSGYTVAVMTNYDPLCAERVSSHLKWWLTGSPIPKIVPKSSEFLKEIEGTYQFEKMPIEMEIKVEKNLCWLISPMMSRSGYYPVGEYRFINQDTLDTIITFEKDPAGKVSGFNMDSSRMAGRAIKKA